jgi:hypothetical protein
VAVAKNWRSTPFPALAIVLNIAYWVIGHGSGVRDAGLLAADGDL